MSSLIVFLVISGLPVLLALLFGVSSVFLFLSIAAGALLQQHLTDSVSLAVSAVIHGGSSDTIASIVLLALPVVLTLVFLRRSTKSSALILQLAPLVLTGLTFGYLVLGQLGGDFQSRLYAGQFGENIKQGSDLAIGLAAVLNLLLAWRLHRTKHDAKHAKHH